MQLGPFISDIEESQAFPLGTIRVGLGGSTGTLFTSGVFDIMGVVWGRDAGVRMLQIK